MIATYCDCNLFFATMVFDFDSKSTTEVHGEIFLEASDTQITVGWETISKD